MFVSSLVSFSKQVWARTRDGELIRSAAQLAYYTLFSLFPFLLMLLAVEPAAGSRPDRDAAASRARGGAGRGLLSHREAGA